MSAADIVAAANAASRGSAAAAGKSSAALGGLGAEDVFAEATGKVAFCTAEGSTLKDSVVAASVLTSVASELTDDTVSGTGSTSHRAEYLPFEGPSRRVCLTGGEPSLQVDSELIMAFHEAGYLIHIETNGTLPLPVGIDWVTVSPKEDVDGLSGDGKVQLKCANELKLVFSHGVDPSRWLSFPALWHFLQPCTLPDGTVNTLETAYYVLTHPCWRLSLQTHKILGIR